MATYGEGMKPDPQQIIKRCEALKRKRENWEHLWDEVAHFVLPTKAYFKEDSVKGRKRDDDLFDSTAISSNQMLASGLHGALTAPSGRWFHIRFRDEGMNDDDEATTWLEDCINRMYKSLEESNFNSEVNELYLDLCCFGTAGMLIERANAKDTQVHLNFKTVHLSELALAEDSDGMVDTIYRKQKMSARQIMQLWPKDSGFDVGESIRQAIENNKPDQEFELIHAVYPREKYLETGEMAPPAERPWASCWVNVKDKKIIQEDGYYEMPWVAPRWSKLSGDVYGFSPALIARADIRTLNEAKRFEMRAWEKSIDPPTLASYNGIIGDLRLDPGGLTYVRDVNAIRPFDSGAQWQVSQIKAQEMITNIRRAFFNDQLQLHDGPNMTATEVRARMELMQQILGPVVGRLQSEFLNPLVKRVFMTMFRAGEFNAPPESLMQENSNLDVEYVSPLARAQRMEEVFAIERWFQQLGTMAQVNPDVIDVIDFDKIGRLLAKRIGVPAEAIRSEDEVAMIKAQREAQQQAMMQQQMQQQGIEQANQAAQVAKTGGEAGADQMAAVAAAMEQAA